MYIWTFWRNHPKLEEGIRETVKGLEKIKQYNILYGEKYNILPEKKITNKTMAWYLIVIFSYSPAPSKIK